MSKNYKYRTYSSHGNYGTNCLFSAILNYIAMIPVGIIMGIAYVIGKILEPIIGSDFKKVKPILEEEKKEKKEENEVLESAFIEDKPEITTNIQIDKKLSVSTNKKNKKLILCPICDNRMIIRTGPYGKFYGCTQYPSCKGKRKISSKRR